MSSNFTSTKSSRGLVIAMLAVSLFGFFDAAYLTFEHFLGKIPPCTLLQGCEKVLTSDYAQIFGVPVAALGMAFYLTMFGLCVLYLDFKMEKILPWLSGFSVVGFVMSLGFLYLQLVVIQAVCLYCLFSAGSSTVLFALGIGIFCRRQKIPAGLF